MTDGVTINGKHSYEDFDLCIKRRAFNPPERQSIRETVPFMHGFYDFSTLNGEPSFTERTVSYTFDLVAESVEDLEDKRREVLDWLMNANEAVIQDDTIPDYHFLGSYDSCNISEDDFGDSLELEVTFVCQPFQIANAMSQSIMAAGTHKVVVQGQTVTPTALATAAATIQIGNLMTSVSAGVKTVLGINLEKGENIVTVTTNGSVTLSWYEEVL